ncbi:DUF2291 family protein [Erwiniaceae bacterium BAC15a-03b]|uniref:DUF2291 family protein n=1 Tax=Winslowiella arboricola TaxID=2978220 RepID=A0A9J6PSM7_9GAMM|nr:DUF2291 family protein [Winslowiella arboricola]MCU5771322.1 DUF2291 family protein [Winslowiella arboricola]MCU5777047.1 DUF2291 family protein [Winslowiella arboricola]
MLKKQWGTSVLFCASLLLTACTVVDLDADGKPIIPPDPNAKASYSNQTPQQVVQENWDSKVMSAAKQHGLDWAAMQEKSRTLKAGSSESVFVKASGQVTAFNPVSERERNLAITFNGTPVEVQLGPVIRSNAIRDAAGFNFEDFTNQVQFAQLTKALNRQTVKQLPPVDASWQGKTVDALLAVTLTAQGVQDAVALTLTPEAP